MTDGGARSYNILRLFSSFFTVLPRIRYLFQHLASQAVIRSSLERGSPSDSTTAVHMISRTAARILNAVPDSKLLDCILRDLIYLAKDLSVLHESGLMEGDGGRSTDAVEVILFQETVESSDWMSIPDFCLQFSSVDALLSVKGATLMIIAYFVEIRRERRLLLLHQHRDALGAVLEELDESYLTAGNPDLSFGIFESDDDCTRALLMSLRQTLLTGNVAECDHANTSPDCGSLTLLSKHGAIQLLLHLHADWDRAGVPSLSLLQETALLVARSAVVFLRTSPAPSADRFLATDLARLIHAFVLVPPAVQSSMTQSAVATVIHGITASMIFESVRYMSNTVESGVAPTTERETRLLEIVLLRCIHAAMLTLQSHVFMSKDNASSFSLQLMLTHDVVGCLFDFLGDPILADSAALTLSHLVCPIQAPQSRISDIENIAKYCLLSPLMTRSHEDPQSLEYELNPASMVPSGSKRKENPTNNSVVLVAATQRKRPKTMTDWSHTNSVSFLDDMLSILFRHVLRSAATIRDKVSGCQGMQDAKVLDSLLFDVGLTCSVIKLLIASSGNLGGVENLFSSALCPHLVQLSDILFETMSTLGSKIVSTRETNKGGPQPMESVVEAIVSCGLLMNSTANGAVAKKQTTACLEFLSSAEGLFRSLNDKQCCFGFSRRLPVLLEETIMGCTMRIEARQETNRRLLSVFGEVLAVGIGSVANIDGIVCSITSLLLTVGFEHLGQFDRLELLAARLGEEWCRPDNLLLQTFDRVKSFIDHGHADPFVRLLVWQCTAWMFLATSPRDFRLLLLSDKTADNASDPNDLTTGNRLVHFLIDVAFADRDPTVRDYTSREIGKVLLTGDWGCLIAAIANDDEWQQLRGSVDAFSAGERHATEQVKSRLFQFVDSVLHKRCSVPQSQLSFAMVSRQPNSPRQDSHATTSVLFFRRAASRTLCSFCRVEQSQTYFGRLLFEHAMIRVVRMWCGVDTAPRCESSGVCFAELSRLFILLGLDLPLKGNMLASFAPALFRDILVPGSSLLVDGAQDGIDGMTNSFRERQFDLLSTFLRAGLVQTWSQTSVSTSSSNDDSDLERCLESCLPHVISQLIVEKDYDALRLTSAYKLYLLGLKRLEHKRRKRSGTSYMESDTTAGIVVGEASLLFAKSPSSKQWSRNLEDQTRQLCLAPGLIEQIIPLVFMRAGRTELIFFTKDVLQDKLSLKQLVSSREMLTLKNFVLELGRNPEMSGSIIRGMETAAVARNQDAGTNSQSIAQSTSATVVRNGDSAISAWLTAHFMYLLVNVVQFRWMTKTDDLRVQALRSLVIIIDFLRSSEAPQYLPQIMATVNAALSHDPDDMLEIQYGGPIPCLQMRLLAVQVLGKFVRLIAETQRSIVGKNLTFIVVSLIPVLSDDEQWLHTQNSSIVEESRRSAVALLEFLTQGDLGGYLASYFSEIPFLPPSSALDSVRASLTSLGVNFDNLQVASTQSTQQDAVSIRSGMSDNGSASASVDSRGAASNATRQNALKRRVETVCSLLGSENASIRRVVLQHLTALLRANRELFQALVENESTTSMKRYLTVAYPGRSGTYTVTKRFYIR